MTTREAQERVEGWFAGRLSADWQAAPAEITTDREEITVRLTLPDVELADDTGEIARAEARAGRAKAFREDTRARRVELAREAEHRYGRKVSWSVRVGDHTELWTHVAAPVMTRLRQPGAACSTPWSRPGWPARGPTRWGGAYGWSGSTRVTG